MGRALNRLTARSIAAALTTGLYCDGGGLYLQVSSSNSKAWIFRYRSPLSRKRRDMGLGSLNNVSLAEARESAAIQRGLLARRIDPIQTREEALQGQQAQAARTLTFAQCAIAYIESHEAAWRNDKHTAQWTNTIATYCNPVIGSLPVQAVDTARVLKILEPIWACKSETASRLRGRIENILDWAKARGYRSGENPARWKGHLNQLLPALAIKSRVIHHPALPFTEVSALGARLRALSGVTARCLEFTILTAARTHEVLHAVPGEFDLDKATWTVPASRMKAKKEHRVPLSPRAVEIVKEMLAHQGDYLFPGAKHKAPLSNMAMLNLLDRMEVAATVHGFRSSFRDWAAERTPFSHEVCEMALAHTIPNAAEAAYRRGDLFEKRRQLMAAWAAYLDESREDAWVIPIKAAA